MLFHDLVEKRLFQSRALILARALAGGNPGRVHRAILYMLRLGTACGSRLLNENAGLLILRHAISSRHVAVGS
jgi:hypothetical protein